MLKACYLLRFLGTTWTAESSFAAYFFILILMSDPVPANIALVSVLIFVSSSPSVNSSNKSLDLKNLLCFGSFKTLFVRNCLKICLQIKNYYMYIQSKRNSNRPKNWALLSHRIQPWMTCCIKSKLLRVTCDIFSLRLSQSSKVCRL